MQTEKSVMSEKQTSLRYCLFAVCILLVSLTSCKNPFVNKLISAGKSDYTIDIRDNGYGMAFTSEETAQKGTVITISAVPFTGYRFAEWQVISGNIIISNNSPTEFIMPDNDVIIRAFFEYVPPNTPNLVLSQPIIFDNVVYGYKQPEAKTITITNTGTGAATITDISLRGAYIYEFNLGNEALMIYTIAANGGTAEFTIQPTEETMPELTAQI